MRIKPRGDGFEPGASKRDTTSCGVPTLRGRHDSPRRCDAPGSRPSPRGFIGPPSGLQTKRPALSLRHHATPESASEIPVGAATNGDLACTLCFLFTTLDQVILAFPKGDLRPVPHFWHSIRNRR